MKKEKNKESITIIKPKKGLIPIDIKEIFKYRELLWTFIVRDIKVRYKQTIIGGLWAILQPFLTMVVFSFFFGKIAKMPSEGVPYPIFSYSGLLLWTYFANSVSNASNSLVGGASLITKVYFPRIILPLSASLVGLLDYFIAGTIILGFMLYYNFIPSIYLFLLPLILFFTWMLGAGVGFFLSAINVKYRDVKYALPFFIQLWIYATPVIYPASVAGQFEWVVKLNPMSGLIEAHRTMILGHHPINWGMLGSSMVFSLIIFISGIYYFKSVERYFADVI
jgi:lipopolysaccharide transport system permease protein